MTARRNGAPQTPRGIRNHNPGNIEHQPGNRWQGLAEPPTDGRFCRFVSAPYGIRAIARVLITYQDRYGLDTITGLIERWAPTSENDTRSYVAHVAKAAGVEPDAPIDLQRFEMLRPVVEAIIRHENGRMPYDDATLTKGLVLAGVEPSSKPLGSSGTIRGAKVAAGATLAAMTLDASQLGTVATQLSGAARTLAELGPTAMGTVALLAIAYIVWRRLDDRRRGLR